jgi:hypothetical protein
MRYNPATDRALSIDEIAAQCRAAILKASTPIEAAIASQPLYDEILSNARWENDLLIAA